MQTLITGLAAALATAGVIAVGKAVLAGQWWKTGTLIFYAMVLVLFVTRRRSAESSRSARHWIFALGGSFLPFALIPVAASSSSGHVFWMTLPLQVTGMAISILALATLGRSFGVIAARRDIKSHGPYALMRHPLYLGEAVWFLSIVLQNACWFNALVFSVQLACQLRRISEEESLLAKDPAYCLYMQTVPYRFIPHLY